MVQGFCMSFIFLPRAEVSPGPCQGLDCDSSPSPSEGESDAGVVILTSCYLGFNMLCRGSGTAMCAASRSYKCMLISDCLLASENSYEAVIKSVCSCLPL